MINTKEPYYAPVEGQIIKKTELGNSENKKSIPPLIIWFLSGAILGHLVFK